MKIFAGRAADIPDIRSRWPQSGFTTPEEAATAFFNAYPLEDDDPQLVDWIAQHIR